MCSRAKPKVIETIQLPVLRDLLIHSISWLVHQNHCSQKNTVKEGKQNLNFPWYIFQFLPTKYLRALWPRNFIQTAAFNKHQWDHLPKMYQPLFWIHLYLVSKAPLAKGSTCNSLHRNPGIHQDALVVRTWGWLQELCSSGRLQPLVPYPSSQSPLLKPLGSTGSTPSSAHHSHKKWHFLMHLAEITS